MAQGLRRRPARTRRLGIGLVVLGAAVGCAGPEKAPSASLPSSLPPPSGLKNASTTTTPKSLSPAASTVDARGGRGGALPVSDSTRAATGIPTSSMGGQYGSIDAPPPPTQGGNFRQSPNSPAANPAGTNWSSSGTPVITPAAPPPVPALPAPDVLRGPAVSDVPQPPGPPVMSVSPPTASPGPAPTLPTVVPK